MDREPIEPRQGRNTSRNVRDGVSPLRGCGNKIDAYPRLTPWATDLAPLCGCLGKTAPAQWLTLDNSRRFSATNMGPNESNQTQMDKLFNLCH